MAKATSIAALAVNLDLNSKKFSQKLKSATNEAAKSKGKFSALAQSASKFGRALGVVGAVIGVAVAAYKKLDAQLEESASRANDFNNSFSDEARGALLAYSEDMEAMSQATGRAWGDAISKYAPAIESIKQSTADLSTWAARVVGAGGDVLNSMMFSDEDMAEWKSKSQQTLTYYKQISDETIKQQQLTYKRASMTRQEYVAERLRSQKAILNAQIALNSNPNQKAFLEQQLAGLKEIGALQLQAAKEADKLGAEGLLSKVFGGEQEGWIKQINALKSIKPQLQELADQGLITGDQLKASFDSLDRQIRKISDDDTTAKLVENLQQTAQEANMVGSAFGAASNALNNMGASDSFAGLLVNMGQVVAQATSAVMALLATAEAKSLAELTFPANLMAYATIASAAASVGSLLGQAHDGLDRVPNTGSYILQQGEMVIPKNDAEQVRNGKGIVGNGGNGVTINPTINSSGRDAESDMQLMNRMKMMILNDLRSNGQIGRAIRNYG